MISVIIPTHNRPEGLKESVLSVINQTTLPAEIVVVDDGSVVPVSSCIFDGAPDTLRCLILRNDVPKGANNSRNKGVLESESEYIAFLDDDDQFVPEKIKEILCFISDESYPDVIYHPAKINMVNEGVFYYSNPKRFGPGDDIFRELLVTNRIGGTPMAIVKRQALVDVGLFDENLPALQDYELWLRLAKHGKKFAMLNRPLTEYFYTTKKSSISKSIDTNSRALSYIEKMYSAEYADLSKKEKKAYEIWKKKKMVHKSLLNGKNLDAIICQLKLFIFSPGVINLISCFAVLLGPKFVFKLKAKLSK